MTAYHLWLPENVWFGIRFLFWDSTSFFVHSISDRPWRHWVPSMGILQLFLYHHCWDISPLEGDGLAYLPPMIAGVLAFYRGKYLWGFIVTAIFTAFEVKASHVQMTGHYSPVCHPVYDYCLPGASHQEKQMATFRQSHARVRRGAMIGISYQSE